LLHDVLDSFEFARGSVESTWGSVRSSMRHHEPFLVKYVAIGNEGCIYDFYRGKLLELFDYKLGFHFSTLKYSHYRKLYLSLNRHYLKFYTTIREAYRNIQMILNCDGLRMPLDHPANIMIFM
jgi:alpha-N-arabinofuranosidase